MAIVDEVTQHMKAAMRAKDKDRLQAIRMIRARIIEISKSGNADLGDQAIVGELRSMVKQRRDAAKTYVDGGRQDLADIELNEIAVIEEFLPKLASAAQTQTWVDEAVASSGASTPRDMGRAMGALMKAHKGEIDGGMASTMIQKALSDA